MAIVYNKGVIMCEQYVGRLSGGTMADVAREHFPSMFESSPNQTAKRFLQDRCPTKNSVTAKRVYNEIRALVNMETQKDTI